MGIDAVVGLCHADRLPVEFDGDVHGFLGFGDGREEKEPPGTEPGRPEVVLSVGHGPLRPPVRELFEDAGWHRELGLDAPAGKIRVVGPEGLEPGEGLSGEPDRERNRVLALLERVGNAVDGHGPGGLAGREKDQTLRGRARFARDAGQDEPAVLEGERT